MRFVSQLVICCVVLYEPHLVIVLEDVIRQRYEGGHPSGRPGTVGQFESGRGKVTENVENREKMCSLPVLCYSVIDSMLTDLVEVTDV